MLFSKRNSQKEIEIFPYDNTLPDRLRKQLYHLLVEVYQIETRRGYATESSALYLLNQPNLFADVRQYICAEHGLLDFSDAPGYGKDFSDPISACLKFLLSCIESDWVVDMIELLFRFAVDFSLAGPETIKTLNMRFRENGVGLEFVEDQFIKIDSTILHTEAIKPALTLMHNAQFAGPLNEYLEAHGQYRDGDNKAAITSAAKSFESTMKTICQVNGWSTGKGTAAALIQALFDNQFLPSYYQTQLTSLRATLDGLPTVRNNNTGHGQGPTIVNTPDYLTQYALNLAGANITLLIKIYNESQK
ncbi:MULTISPECIES: STM4504/CBY_0614 family protein [unclassified Exiguobacterium]|uniref:STM4504/CBY_0614 family protein n=1 Tax=unclassified Exiguobacterium TaxID=2644629 RepID=UPI0008D238D1|nr:MULTISPECIES: hypothetical protein [unclassified Exiguobacterium]OGX77773.1 hypothetical protein A6395_15540 [Exiguobacterium sp. SH31]TCI59054.1 hypothetical protein EVJ21_14045 [Exiguobacterium sp. SH0S2]